MKKQMPTPYKINCYCKTIYYNPHGFSIRLVLTKLVAQTTQLILYGYFNANKR